LLVLGLEVAMLIDDPDTKRRVEERRQKLAQQAQEAGIHSPIDPGQEKGLLDSGSL